MKKYLSIYTLLALACIVLQSCLFSEEEIFDESSANRATADVIKCQEILKDVPNGWKLHSIEKTTANLAVVSSQVKGLMSNDIPQLTSKLNTIGDNFVVISGNLKEVDYAATFKKIDETLANVKILTEKLNSKDNTIGLLFNDPTLYNNLNATTENAASLLEDLKEHPKRYVHFSLFGKKDK